MIYVSVLSVWIESMSPCKVHARGEYISSERLLALRLLKLGAIFICISGNVCAV